MKIEKEILIDIINAAIEYGGDLGGPYFNNRGKKELINELTLAGYEVKFDEIGFVKDILRKKDT